MQRGKVLDEAPCAHVPAVSESLFGKRRVWRGLNIKKVMSRGVQMDGERSSTLSQVTSSPRWQNCRLCVVPSHPWHECAAVKMKVCVNCDSTCTWPGSRLCRVEWEKEVGVCRWIQSALGRALDLDCESVELITWPHRHYVHTYRWQPAGERWAVSSRHSAPVTWPSSIKASDGSSVALSCQICDCVYVCVFLFMSVWVFFVFTCERFYVCVWVYVYACVYSCVWMCLVCVYAMQC